MTERPRSNLVDIVAHNYDATPAFYRRLGAEVEDGPPGEIHHAHIHHDGVEVHIDNEHLAGISGRAGFVSVRHMFRDAHTRSTA